MGTKKNFKSNKLKSKRKSEKEMMIMKTSGRQTPTMRDLFSEDFMMPSFTMRSDRFFRPLFQFPTDFPFSNPGESQKTLAWKEEMEVEIAPTEAKDLKICVNDQEKTITISGQSESTKESANKGFKSRSVHHWEQKMMIPDDIDPESIKVKQLKNNSTLYIKSKRREPTTEEFTIPVTIE